MMGAGYKLSLGGGDRLGIRFLRAKNPSHRRRRLTFNTTDFLGYRDRDEVIE
jgi:hypothetical protein